MCIRDREDAVKILKKEYSREYVGNLFNSFDDKYLIGQLCLRRYKKLTDGYHRMHYDNEGASFHRYCAGILYLNTIKEGGETCFPILGREVKPVKGRIVFFPSHFTHVHYGARALTENKYIFAIHISNTKLYGLAEEYKKRY